MKYFKITLLALGLMIASVAYADCYSMKNADNKNVCLAKPKVKVAIAIQCVTAILKTIV